MQQTGPRDVQLAQLLDKSVHAGVFPGCVARVEVGGEIVHASAHGTLGCRRVPQAGAQVSPATLYDLASLTKVLCTTTLAGLAVEAGLLALTSPMPEPWSAPWDRAQVARPSLQDVLAHCSGLAAHREYFASIPPFDADAVVAAVLATDLTYAPRSRAVYSDLGFILLGRWLEDVWGGTLDVLMQTHVCAPLGLNPCDLGFRPLAGTPALDHDAAGMVAPTEVYDATLWDTAPSHVHARAHLPYALGHVHDDNAYVMGGAAGHAGLFGHAQAVAQVANAWLGTTLLPRLTQTVCASFAMRSPVADSTRALGWDTPGTTTPFSPRAFGHTGFTGTSVWVDPARDATFVLLSNRVHPTRANTGIVQVRQAFHQQASRLAPPRLD